MSGFGTNKIHYRDHLCIAGVENESNGNADTVTDLVCWPRLAGRRC
jgi:hypothetical protein